MRQALGRGGQDPSRPRARAARGTPRAAPRERLRPHPHGQLRGRSVQLDADLPRGLHGVARLRSAAVPARPNRQGRRHAGRRAVPRGHEARRGGAFHAQPLPPVPRPRRRAGPPVPAGALRRAVRRLGGRAVRRRADGRVLGPRRELVQAGAVRRLPGPRRRGGPRLRADRRRDRGVHGRSPRVALDGRALRPQGLRRRDLRARHQPPHAPPLGPPAVRSEVGARQHDGLLGHALRRVQHLV